jgi:chromate reductase, NAD(P)H dehydrogenase (quinone)
MKLLAISGSLREASTNTILLRAIGMLSPACTQFRIYDGISRLPHFNSDLDIEPPLEEVKQWRDALHSSSAVLISTPEYAHGLPGSLKNALDWVVRSGELYGKPVAIVQASRRSTYARAALQEVLITMGVRLIEEASVSVPLLGTQLMPEEVAGNPAFAEPLRAALHALFHAVESP